MTMQKRSAQNLSRAQSDADARDLPTGSSGLQRSGCKDSVLRYVKPANHPNAMTRCVERHRRFLAAVGRFSRRRPANCWPARATVWLGLAVSQFLERSARRRLIHLKAIDSCEAQQKILYLIAASVTHKMELQPAEIAAVASSLDGFRTDMADLLQSSRPAVTPPLQNHASTGSRFDRLIWASAKLDSIEETPSSRVSFSFKKRS